MLIILFPVSHSQLMSRCAGVGSEHSQGASPSCPVEIFHTTDAMRSLQMRVGQEEGTFFSVSSNPLFSGSLNFSRSLVFFP